MGERASGIEDLVEEIDILVKENVKSKINPGTEHSGNLGCYEKLNLRII